MKKMLYIAPAFIVCMFIGTIGLLFGFSGFEPVAWGYLFFSVLGSTLLCKGKWWGGLVGAIMGALVLWGNRNDNADMVMNTRPIGIVFLAYYLLMAVVCLKNRRSA